MCIINQCFTSFTSNALSSSVFVTMFNNRCLSCSSCQCVWRRARSVCVCLHESRLNSTSGVWGRPLWIVAQIFQIVKGWRITLCVCHKVISHRSPSALLLYFILGYSWAICFVLVSSEKQELKRDMERGPEN